jgi:hypothetical protein
MISYELITSININIAHCAILLLAMYGLYCNLNLYGPTRYPKVVCCGDFNNCLQDKKLLWVYALAVTAILFHVFMDKQFGSIFNFHLEYNVISHVMSKVMETVLRFRAVIHCNVWESLIAHVT